MIFGDVEHLKVVLVVLNLRALVDHKAHAHKDVAQLIESLGEGMEFSDLPPFSGLRHVDLLRLEAKLALPSPDLSLLGGKDRLDVLARFVDHLANLGALLGGNAAMERRSRSARLFCPAV